MNTLPFITVYCSKAHHKLEINTITKRNNSLRAKLAFTAATFDERIMIKNLFFCLWTTGHLRSRVIHGKALIMV